MIAKLRTYLVTKVQRSEYFREFSSSRATPLQSLAMIEVWFLLHFSKSAEVTRDTDRLSLTWSSRSVLLFPMNLPTDLHNSTTIYWFWTSRGELSMEHVFCGQRSGMCLQTQAVNLPRSIIYVIMAPATSMPGLYTLGHCNLNVRTKYRARNNRTAGHALVHQQLETLLIHASLLTIQWHHAGSAFSVL